MVSIRIARSIISQKILKYFTSYQFGIEKDTIERIGKNRFATVVMIMDDKVKIVHMDW